jgi:hypothetical protein
MGIEKNRSCPMSAGTKAHFKGSVKTGEDVAEYCWHS